MKRLAEKTNKWFVKPSSKDEPKNPKFWVFASLVSCLGPDSRLSDRSLIRGYFTYLLLERDPSTNQVLKSSPVGKEFVEWLQDLKLSYAKLLDPKITDDRPMCWNLLVAYRRAILDHTEVELANRLHEHFIYLGLALTMLGSSTRPKFLLFSQACLELYQRAMVNNKHLTLAVEFTNPQPMFYNIWLTELIDETFKIRMLSRREVFSLISYMAWYMNLIRCVRALSVEPSNKVGQELHDLLLKEVEAHRHVVNDAPLRVVSQESS